MKRPSLRRVLLASVAAEPLEIGNFLAWADRNGQTPTCRINLNLDEVQAKALTR